MSEIITVLIIIIEKLYYSAGNNPICVYCANDQLYTDENKYLQYTAC